MADKLDQFLKKIHDPKNKLPLYITIIVRPGKKLVDVKIKKEEANILRVIAHEEKSSGYFIHSFHIPIKNLGLTPDSKDKEILAILSNPIRIFVDPNNSIWFSLRLWGILLFSKA